MPAMININNAGGPASNGGALSAISFFTSILPFIDQGNVYNSYDMNQPWFSVTSTAGGQTNANLAATVINAYICPSVPRSFRIRDCSTRHPLNPA